MTVSTAKASLNSHSPFMIGNWLVDPRSLTLDDGESQVKLEPKVMDVLVYLAQRPGQVISRQELESQVWHGTVVSYHALSHTMLKLRKAFDDDPKQARIVETLSKRGYRLIAAVNPATTNSEYLALPVKQRQFDLAYTLTSIVLAVVALTWLLTQGITRNTQENTSSTISLAVLPFGNLSNDSHQDYFSDGLTEDLITDLSRHKSLRIISPATIFAYKKQVPNLKQIAGQLDVHYIIEGSVRREHSELHITARLTEAQSGFQLWVQRFDGNNTELFQLQQQISERLYEVLQQKHTLSAPDITARHYSRSLEAYDALLNGLQQFGNHTREGNQAARNEYEKAITLDPTFARAYAAQANTYRRDWQNRWQTDTTQALTKARQLVAQALSLDDDLAQAYFIQGLIQRDTRQHKQAIASAEQAIQRDPNYADAYVLLGSSLCFGGRAKQGLPLIEKAKSLNPIHPSNYLFYEGICQFIQADYDSATRAFQAGLVRNPDEHRLRLWLAAILALNDQTDEAQWQITELSMHKESAKNRWQPEEIPFRDQYHLQQFKHGLTLAGWVTD